MLYSLSFKSPREIFLGAVVLCCDAALMTTFHNPTWERKLCLKYMYSTWENNLTACWLLTSTVVVPSSDANLPETKMFLPLKNALLYTFIPGIFLPYHVYYNTEHVKRWFSYTPDRCTLEENLIPTVHWNTQCPNNLDVSQP